MAIVAINKFYAVVRADWLHSSIHIISYYYYIQTLNTHQKQQQKQLYYYVMKMWYLAKYHGITTDPRASLAVHSQNRTSGTGKKYVTCELFGHLKKFIGSLGMSVGCWHR